MEATKLPIKTRRGYMQQFSRFLQYADEVRAALDEKRAVVALESTVISHGLPHPKNIEAAQAMEAAIRAEGAVPATIGLLEGQIKIGLTANEVERFATVSGIQ